MAIGDCTDCDVFDIEWMYKCDKHKGVEYFRGCECPFCTEENFEDDDDDYFLSCEIAVDFAI